MNIRTILVAILLALGITEIKAQQTHVIEPAVMEVNYHVIFGHNYDDYALRIGAHPHGCAIYLYGWHIRNGRSPCKDRQQLTADMPQGGRSFSRLKTLVLRGLSPCVAKGRLSHCKRWPFSVQKTAFWKAKDRLLRKKQTKPAQSLGAQRFGVMRRLRRGVAQS